MSSMLRSPSETLERITSTFSVDDSYANALLLSTYAKEVAKLLVWQDWRTQYGDYYDEIVEQLVEKRFRRDSAEKALIHSVSLLQAINRDVTLPIYLLIRGLAFDGLFFIRRALENLGVLTHYWKHTNRVDVLDSEESEQFRIAFQSGPPEYSGRRIQWRFEALQLLGREATILYRELSALIAHGGTLGSTLAGDSKLSCSLLSRDSIDESLETKLEIIAAGTLIIHANIAALFRTYMSSKDVAHDGVSEANGVALAFSRSSNDEQVNLLDSKAEELLAVIRQ